MKRITLALTCLFSAATFASCLVPGKYRIYRVAFADAQLSPGCFPGGVPDSEINDSTTFKSGGTFAIFAADDDVFYLELEDASIEGTKKGTSDYEFEGTSVDVEPNGDITITTTRHLQVDIEKSGRKVKGKSVDDVTVTCNGNGCPDNSQCTLTIEFEGAEIEGVDLEHSV